MSAKPKKDPAGWSAGLEGIFWTGQGDRGLVIAGTAFLEAHLERLIRRALVQIPAETDRFVDRLVLEGKIRLAQLLGLIPAEIAADLHELRRVRNEFAHDATRTFLEPFSERLRVLNAISAPEVKMLHATAAAEHCFKSACYVIARYLQAEADSVAPYAAKAPFRWAPPE